MNLTQKISQMTPKGADLAATDLIEVSTLEAGSYVTKSITGQELIDAIPLPPTGLTIGTTPISSGTIGRVLFEGTGNVVQESANLFWDNANTRLGIGTSAPSSTIEVVGTAKVTTLLPTTGGFTGSVGTSAVPFANMYAVNYNSPGNATLIASQSTYLGAGNTFGFVLFQSTRNVLIQNGGTFTDAGYRLDVNGSMRVGSANQSLIFTPTATSPILEQNGSVSSRIKCISGTRVIEFENYAGDANYLTSTAAGLWIRTIGLHSMYFRTNNTTAGQISTSQNWSIGSTIDAGYKLDVNGTARVQGKLSVNTPTQASAVMEITSTTQGFLPPRMTTTQKNAIASPAAGLIVYDTTLNLPHFFNGTIWVSL